MGGILYVDLRQPDDDEPTLDDDRPISVRDALVFLEVAVFFSPASHPNAGEMIVLDVSVFWKSQCFLTNLIPKCRRD